MPPDLSETLSQSIRAWSGVECPNEAAKLGLNDFPGLLKEFEELRGTMVFEDEPSSFEAALLAEKEPAK